MNYHSTGKRTSVRVNSGKITSAQILKNFINFKSWHKSLTSAHVMILHGAEVNMPTEVDAEVTPADSAVLSIDGPMAKRFKYNKFSFWIL